MDLWAKAGALLEAWGEHEAVIGQVLGDHTLAWLREQRDALAARVEDGEGPLIFLGVDRARWADMLHRAVAHVLTHRSVEAPARCLAYLHVAAFLEQAREHLARLGVDTVEALREADDIGPEPGEAQAFYEEQVEPADRDLVRAFFSGRERLRALLKGQPSGSSS